MNTFIRTFTTIIVVLLICSARIPTIYADTLETIPCEERFPELLEKADKLFNLDNQDAVILSENRSEFWFTDGRLKTRIHRIVWINSKVGIGRYADLRVPYDAVIQSFTVSHLRTWRDGRWWESGETAIVETLPFALQKAYDYTNMREMMLLHDGIELPCILEVEYVIEDTPIISPPAERGGNKRGGHEGLYLFAKEDPALELSLNLGFPKGSKPQIYSSKGIKTNKVSSEDLPGMDIYTHKMENVTALHHPHTVDPAGYMPHVAWSSWNSWNYLGSDLKSSFKSGLKLNDALRDSLSNLLDGAWAMTEKARRIAEFVDRSTRYINYPVKYWQWDPRPAYQTYATAYGHRLDRAILAAALFQEAGFTVFPFFRGAGYGNINEEVATMARMDGISVWISASEGIEAYYDPVASEIHNGLSPIFGRTIWIPGSGDDPNIAWRGEGTQSRFEMRLDISYNEEEKEWNGHGYYNVTHGFNSYDRMEGTGSQASDYLQKVVSGVIKDAEVTDYTPTTFNRFTLSVGFEFNAPLGEKDNYGRYNLTIGEPAGGIFEMLPDDIELFHEKRGSPIRTTGLMDQTVSIRLHTDGWELVYKPVDVEMKNQAGSLQVSTEEMDNTITVTRQLVSGKVNYASKDWADLRVLLLGDRNERHRMLLLKKME